MYQVMCRQTTRVMTEAVCGYRIGHFVWINTGGALSTARGRMFKHRSLIELHFQKKKKKLHFLRRETGKLSTVGEASPRKMGRG